MAPRKIVRIAVVYPSNFPIDGILSAVKEKDYYVRFSQISDDGVDYSKPASEKNIFKLLGDIASAHHSVLIVPQKWGNYSTRRKGRASFIRFVYRVVYGGILARRIKLYILHNQDGHWYGDKDQIAGAATEVGIAIESGSEQQLIHFLSELAFSTKV